MQKKPFNSLSETQKNVRFSALFCNQRGAAQNLWVRPQQQYSNAWHIQQPKSGMFYQFPFVYLARYQPLKQPKWTVCIDKIAIQTTVLPLFAEDVGVYHSHQCELSSTTATIHTECQQSESVQSTITYILFGLNTIDTQYVYLSVTSVLYQLLCLKIYYKFHIRKH